MLGTFNLQTFPNVDTAVAHLNNTIMKESSHHIREGSIKDYSTNFLPLIKQLIKQTNMLKQVAQPTPYKTKKFKLTKCYNHRTNQHSKRNKNWENYISSIDYKTNKRKLWRIAMNIHTSMKGRPPMHEALLSPTGTIPSNKKQADNLIKYYTSISHKPTSPLISKTTRKLKRIKTDSKTLITFTIKQFQTTIRDAKKIQTIRLRQNYKHTSKTCGTKCHSLYQRCLQLHLKPQLNS